MNREYWQRKATPWVSAAVLAGGLLTACILFLVVRAESNIQITSTNLTDPSSR